MYGPEPWLLDLSRLSRQLKQNNTHPAAQDRILGCGSILALECPTCQVCICHLAHGTRVARPYRCLWCHPRKLIQSRWQHARSGAQTLRRMLRHSTEVRTSKVARLAVRSKPESSDVLETNIENLLRPHNGALCSCTTPTSAREADLLVPCFCAELT